MKIRVKDEKRQCNNLSFKLCSIDMNFATKFNNAVFTTEDLEFPNECVIEFIDGLELEQFIYMLGQVKAECEEVLGKWHRDKRKSREKQTLKQ